MTAEVLPPVRPEGWETRLGAEMTAAGRRTFAWGVHDCATFANGCVVAMFGISPWSGRFEPYENGRGAARRLAVAGGFEAVLDEQAARCDPRAAWRGDLALVDVEGADAIAVFDIGGLRLPGRPAGLALVPAARARLAWRLGH